MSSKHGILLFQVKRILAVRLYNAYNIFNKKGYTFPVKQVQWRQCYNLSVSSQWSSMGSYKLSWACLLWDVFCDKMFQLADIFLRPGQNFILHLHCKAEKMPWDGIYYIIVSGQAWADRNMLWPFNEPFFDKNKSCCSHSWAFLHLPWNKIRWHPILTACNLFQNALI